jgi:2'-5' RNA ligase
MRTFIAIDIPPDIRNNIGGLIRECKNIRNFPVKYVEIINIHITLKFLGEIENDSLQLLFDDFGKISLPVSKLTVYSAGAFPSLNFAKVAWVGIRENPDLNNAFIEIEKIAKKYSFMPEEREFHPHITIGRIKGRVSDEWVLLIKKYSDFDFGSFMPDGFSVYRSDLSKGGPVYTKLAFFPFKEAQHGK